MRGLTVLLMLFLLSTYTHAQPAAPEPILTLGRGEIVSAAWAPDGQSIWIGTTAGTWQLDTNLREIAAYPHITYAALSPDGTKLAGISADGFVGLWETATGHEIWKTGLRTMLAESPTWSPDGSRFAYNFRDSLYMLTLADLQATVLSHSSVIRIKWSPSGRYLAVYDSFEGIRVIDIDTQGYIPIENHTQYGRLHWRGDSALLAVRFGDDTLGTSMRWSIPEGEFSTGAADWCQYTCAFASDGSLIAGGKYSGVYVGNLEGYWQLYSSQGVYFKNVTWSANGRSIAVTEYSFPQINILPSVLVFDVFGRQLLWKQSDLSFAPDRIEWNPDGTRLFVAESGRIALLDTMTGNVIARYDDFIEPRDVAPDTSGKRLAISDPFGSVRVAETATGEILAEIEKDVFPVKELAWQPNGDRLAIYSVMELGSRGNVRIWNAYGSEPLTSLIDLPPDESIERGANSMLWSPNGSIFAVSSQGVIQLYFGQTEELRIPNMDHIELDTIVVSAVEWLPDEQLPIAAYYVCCAGRMINLNTEETYGSPASHSVAAFDAKGTYVAVSWADYGDGGGRTYLAPELTIYSANPQTFVLEGIGDKTDHAWMSPEATQIAAIDASGSGLIWDATTGQPLDFLADVHDLVWTPDDSTLAILRRDGSLWLQNAAVLRLLWSPTVPVRAPGTLVWSGDGSTLAHTQDGVLRVWRP